MEGYLCPKEVEEGSAPKEILVGMDLSLVIW
jgi:hypothetical protein